MNVEIGTDTQFPEKEYINGIFLAVHFSKILKAQKKLGVQQRPRRNIAWRIIASGLDFKNNLNR
jgi:hypothetical protein